jgi:ATP-dependent DNA helicase RecG
MAKAKNNVAFDPRPYMELAIAEMNDSKNEPRIDGKVPPKVGAVILFPDGKVVQAHRGELREGDHAEFTLMERKLANEKLDGCILFTTLEPCVERNPPKVPCCRRTTNARIKEVYVGINDPDPTVDGKGVKHLEKNGVKVTMFDRDLQLFIEKENADFRKQALERKRQAEVDEPLPLIEQPVAVASYDEFSAEALQKFIVEAKLNFKIEDVAFQKYLADLGALALYKQTNIFKPTGVGILLFGSNPRLLFKQASLKCSVNYGNNEIETKDFDQPLVLIPDLVENWVKKVLPQIKDTSNFKRQDNSVFPIDVLREAVVNAIVHRDYTIDGAKSYLQIDNETILVKSPGAPLPSISIEQLNTFKAPSISRNPIITYVFNLMSYVEETGFGMDALRSLNEKYGLPLPSYTYENPFLNLTFPRTIDAFKKVSQIKGLTNLNDEEVNGYEFVKLHGSVKRKEYEEHFGFEKKKAERHLNKMVEEGLISKNGAGPSTHYEIIAT